MKAVKLIILLGLGALVSACADPQVTTRNIPFETQPPVTTDAASLSFAAEAPDEVGPVWHQTPVSVKEIDVTVPRTLSVSEDNRYLPRADIVWRDDPIGDRYEQIEAIFDTALAQGVQSLDGKVPVSISVEVMRFHSLTERARRVVGGVHSISFKLSVRDLKSGEPLGPDRIIEADLLGLGGRQAEAAEARGETQKVRITAHLAQVIRNELTRPDGHVNANLGFIQQLNKL